MGLFDRFLLRLEHFGYKAANASHKVAVTGLFIGTLYGFYSLFRDYRSYFKIRRTEEYSEHLKKREELIRKLIETREKPNSD